MQTPVESSALLHYAEGSRHLIVTILPTVAMIILVLSLVLVLAGSIGEPSPHGWRNYARQRRNDLGLSSLIALVIIVLCLCERKQTWGFFLALVPPLLITHHAVMLGIYASRMLTMHSDGEPSEENLSTPAARARNTIVSYFSYRTLLLRFGLPVIMLAIAGVLVFRSLTLPESMSPEIWNSADVMRGAKYGALGAYTYLILELSRRTFRRDITSAFALWCVVSVLLGPLLAAIASVLWSGSSSTENWQSAVLFFFAGFAPRRVISALEHAARQLLVQPHEPVSVSNRMIPLSSLRGIVPAVEERLFEEGIYDVHSLAQAEPVRLLRNTSFDFRQILVWVDEALLITRFPHCWEAIEKCGIFGIVELSSCCQRVPVTGATDSGGVHSGNPDLLSALAKELKMGSPEEHALFRASVDRLANDSQVQHINALYHYTGKNNDGIPLQKLSS